jgi:hypothetical protein
LLLLSAVEKIEQLSAPSQAFPRKAKELWFGLVWFGLVWFGLVWFGLVWLLRTFGQPPRRIQVRGILLASRERLPNCYWLPSAALAADFCRPSVVQVGREARYSSYA